MDMGDMGIAGIMKEIEVMTMITVVGLMTDPAIDRNGVVRTR